VVLDRDLPDNHGGTLRREHAEKGSCAKILMLTAASPLDDRVMVSKPRSGTSKIGFG
jgi:DNA-binding response OmpR family regulator